MSHAHVRVVIDKQDAHDVEPRQTPGGSGRRQAQGPLLDSRLA